MHENEKKLVIKGIKVIIIFMVFLSALKATAYYSSIETEEKILGAEEIIDIKKQIKYLMDNGYRDKKMNDIFEAYDTAIEEMVPVEGIYYVDFAKVKQSYRIDKKYGWIPIGLPEIVIIYNQ
nr:hypothetical protein [Sedimentibacter sp.]